MGNPLLEISFARSRRPLNPFTLKSFFVDDGSPDKAWEAIQTVCAENPRVKGVRLSRNFGQHFAITAGLRAASGHYVAVMDCDLQDDPRYLTQLLEQARSGHDVVYTHKFRRNHPPIKNFLAVTYARIFNWLSGRPDVRQRPLVGCFSLLSRKAVDAFLLIGDSHRHYLYLLGWLGFRSAYVEVEHRKREIGRSSYTLRKLVAHAFDGIVSQSDRLLYLSVGVGFAFLVVSLVSAAVIVVCYFTLGFKEGWPSLIVTVLLSTGVILLSLGVNGIYLAKAYEQSKGRPLFIVDETLNLGPIFPSRKDEHPKAA